MCPAVTIMFAIIVMAPLFGLPLQSIDTPGAPTLPSPVPPAERYVPEQRMYSPEAGRDVVVPGHYAGQAPGGQVIEPPRVIPDPNGGPPAFIPGGERPAGSVP
jgi:hypothetical protein